jgi:hypothetical protein
MDIIEAVRRRPVSSSPLATPRTPLIHDGILDQGVNFLSKPFALDRLAVKVSAILETWIEKSVDGDGAIVVLGIVVLGESALQGLRFDRLLQQRNAAEAQAWLKLAGQIKNAV